MDNMFFPVKFAVMKDYDFVKYRGPWMIFNYYLTIRTWKPNFDPKQSDLKNFLVWVMIPYLPIGYYDKSFLMKAGEKIDNPIKFDEATSLA